MTAPEPAATWSERTRVPVPNPNPNLRWLPSLRWLVVVLVGLVGLLVLLAGASTTASAHELGESTAASGLGLPLVIAVTVTLGVVGGIVVIRRQSARRHRLSPRGVSVLLIGLGCWAALAAVQQAAWLAVGIVVAGAMATWSLRNRVVGGHPGCDQVALGAVVLHRFFEGALLAAVFTANAAVGTGAALFLGLHAAVETGAVTGLWVTGRWVWAIIAVVQAGFVTGAIAGGLLIRFVTPVTSVVVLALVGGALIAAGLVTIADRRLRIRDEPTLDEPTLLVRAGR